MKTKLSVQSEMNELENLLNLAVLLGPDAYLSDEAYEMRKRLQELRMTGAEHNREWQGGVTP